jgi:hypothetical protein
VFQAAVAITAIPSAERGLAMAAACPVVGAAHATAGPPPLPTWYTGEDCTPVEPLPAEARPALLVSCAGRAVGGAI